MTTQWVETRCIVLKLPHSEKASFIREFTRGFQRRRIKGDGMMRTIALLSVMSASILQAAEQMELPRELKSDVAVLQLRNVEVMWDERVGCLYVIGVKQDGRRVVGISKFYVGSVIQRGWTPMVAVTLEADNDKFTIDKFIDQDLFLQWSSVQGFESMSGYYIQFDPKHRIIQLISIPRNLLQALLG